MERRAERRKVAWAVLASVLVHLIVALSLAAFSRGTAPEIAVEEKPVELTMVDLSTPPPLVPKNPEFVETDPAKAAAEKPKEQTFESNANSIAASNVPASGEAPLPSQLGKERPFMNLDTRQLSLPNDGSRAQPRQPERKPDTAATPAQKPSVAPTAAPTATATATPVPPAATPEPEQLAMLRPTPTPAIKPPDETDRAAAETQPASTPPPTPKPEKPASDFQALKEQTRISGRLTNRGPSAVNAVGTPLGRYQKQVSDAIGSRWYYYMKNKIDLVSVGTAHVEAVVDAQGHVQNLRVLSNNANEAFANICLQSFQEAKLPPIPPDLVAALPGGKMPVDFYFTTYSN